MALIGALTYRIRFSGDQALVETTRPIDWEALLAYLRQAQDVYLGGQPVTWQIHTLNPETGMYEPETVVEFS